MPIPNTTIDDQECFNLIRKGGSALEQGVTMLYGKYAAHLCKWLIRQSGKKLTVEDAEDIMQETFVKVSARYESYKGDSTIKTWIWSIANHCMADHFRKNKSRPAKNLNEEEWVEIDGQLQNRPDLYEGVHLYTGTKQPDLQVLSKLYEDCLARGFDEFSKRFGERAYALSLWSEGNDTGYIAEALNRSEGATRTFLSECRKRIQEFLLPCKEYYSAA